MAEKKQVWQHPAAPETPVEKLQPASVGATGNLITSNNVKVTAGNVHSLGVANSKASNSIFSKYTLHDFLGGKYKGVNVAKHGNQLPYNVPITFDVDKGVILPKGFDISPTMERILMAAAAIFHSGGDGDNGPVITTAKNIANIMSGRDTAPSVNTKTEANIVDNIREMLKISIHIDASEHRKYNALDRRRKQLPQSFYEGHLFPGDIVVTEEETYIRIFSASPIFAYTRDLGQIQDYPKHFFDLTKVEQFNAAGDVIHSEKTVIKNMSGQQQDIFLFLLKEKNRIERQTPKSKRGSVRYERIYSYLLKGNSSRFDLSKPGSKGRVDKNIDQVAQIMVEKGIIRAVTTEGKGRTKRYKLVITAM